MRTQFTHSVLSSARAEAVRLFQRALLGLVVFWVTRDWQLALLVTLFLYLLAHFHNLLRLHAWVMRPKRSALPDVGGLWGDIFDGLSALQRQNRKRKRRLSAILSEFQASTAALPDGAVVLTPRGEIVWFNNAAQVLLGLRVPQDNGQRVANLIRHPSFTSYFSREEYADEAVVPSPVNINVTLSLRVIPYGEGQRLMIIRDVSQVRRLDVARRDFVANASHELRTPLTVLHGYLDMMQPEAAKGDTLTGWKKPLDEMFRQVARMESLIDDLLKLARLESDIVQVRQDLLDVPAMLDRQRSAALTISRGRHRLEFDVDPELQLYGREDEIQSVFSNLIMNAMNYTLPGGVVRVRWQGDVRGARFVVADSGIGIAETDLPRITERFYRVDVGRSRASGGTGLGLSIVKHALEQHEARLYIESELGVGSTFTCEFPAQRVKRRSQTLGTELPADYERHGQ